MKIAAVQMEVTFCEPERNYQRARHFIEEAARNGADTVVLPELFTTGFFPKDDLDHWADLDGDMIRNFGSAIAKEFHINLVAGSVLTKRDEKYYNTSFVFDREGNQVACYDKIHLFSFSGENNYFSPGSNLCTFELDGVPCGLIICYDVRFLEQVRSLCLKGIDILFVPAAWPEKRREHWTTLNRARAIENQIYVVNVNVCGEANNTLHAGHSAIISPWGEYLAQAELQEELLISDVDFGVVKEIRETINVYRDRRPDLYRLD